MKQFYILLLVMTVLGCVSQVRIPTPPVWEQVKIYDLGFDAFCVDPEQANILKSNIIKMKEYQRVLLQLLEDK